MLFLLGEVVCMKEFIEIFLVSRTLSFRFVWEDDCVYECVCVCVCVCVCAHTLSSACVCDPHILVGGDFVFSTVAVVLCVSVLVVTLIIMILFFCIRLSSSAQQKHLPTSYLWPV